MRGIRRKASIAVVAGALVVLVAGSASAATSSWYWSDRTYIKVGNCRLDFQVRDNNGTVIEEGSNGCPGYVYAQAQWTNGQSTYTSGWSNPGTEIAYAGQFMTVAVRGQHS